MATRSLWARLIGPWAIGIGFVNLVLAYTGVWPWQLALVFGGLAVAGLWRSPLARSVHVRYGLGSLFLFGGVVVPVLSGLRAAGGFWLLAAFLSEVAIALWIWQAVRDRFVPAEDYPAVLGSAGILGGRVMISGDDRYLHLHVIGPTGSGKTASVLSPLIRQDLRRPVGLTVIDPKGDLAAAVAAEAASLDRAVYALGPGFPASFNPLAGEPSEVAEAMVEAVDKLFLTQDGFFRTLGRTLLRQAVLALKSVPGESAGLVDLQEFLSEEDRRRQVLVETTDPEVKAYFRREYAQWTVKAQREYTLGLRNALQALSDHPEARRMMSGEEALPLARILAEGEVLVVSLPVGQMGEAGRVFGAYLLARLQQAALGRPAGPPHFLYVDEFQTFATSSFAQFLDLARQDRLGAVLAHQNLGQLPESLIQSVLANCRNRVLLGGVSGEDLSRLRDTLGAKMGVRVSEDASGQVKSRTLVMETKFRPEMVHQMPRGLAIAQVVFRGRLLDPRLIRLPTPRAS